MPGIGNNLYPPVVASYMPAFLRTGACKIYFSLSNYNSLDEIKNVQVTISNQNTNLSALAVGKYPAGIKITTIHEDDERVGNDRFYVEISPSDLVDGQFELNQYYKVQLRFTGAGATTLVDPAKIANWLVTNQGYFSEWSTVCLVKGIETPILELKGFTDVDNSNTQNVIFTSEIVDFVGSIKFSDTNEKECLKNYRIKIYKISDDSLFYDSGILYPEATNSINHTLKIALEDGITYKLELEYLTTNEYQGIYNYTFAIIQNTINPLKATINATAEEDLGRIKVHVAATVSEIFFGNLTIRRTSSESNFTIWEDIHQTTIVGSILDYTWYDYTIESGVWYKYCAQKRNSQGDRGSIVTIRQPIMAVFEDMYLTRGDMQIRLKYDPQISSFKKTLLESKVDTIGGKYPIIRRNGNTGYRQFPISGLITAFCDEEGIFINKENVYGNTISYYENYNLSNKIDEYKDFIYEREFREKIMDFLHANTIKLFRSTTEGNILVRLMDISFTPNQTLGRMLYSFTATAYEIDECSLSNFNKYGIQLIGEYSDDLSYHFTKVGQLQGKYGGNGQDILNVLRKKYAATATATDLIVNEVNYLKWVRIEFNSPPYLIKTENGLVPLRDTEEKDKEGNKIKREVPEEDTILGYIVYINSKPILVSPRGYYELMEDDIQITSITFPIECDVTIDYIVEIDQFENTSLLYNKMYFYTKVGQIGDSFDYKENVFLRIYEKYLLNYKKYHQSLLALNKIAIESVPGAICYIKDSFDEDYFRHEIGSTGVLELDDPETAIDGIRFDGIQLYPKESTIQDVITIKINDINNFTLIDIQDDEVDALSLDEYTVKTETGEEETIQRLIFNNEYFGLKNSAIVAEKQNFSEPRDNEYIIINNEVSSLNQIIQPIKNAIYTIDGKQYILHQVKNPNSIWGKWAEVAPSENPTGYIIKCPVDALIDYVYEMMKGEY